MGVFLQVSDVCVSDHENPSAVRRRPREVESTAETELRRHQNIQPGTQWRKENTQQNCQSKLKYYNNFCGLRFHLCREFDNEN